MATSLTRSRRFARRSAGFTLVEMIVATFVLAIGIVGVLEAFNAASRASNAAAEVNRSALLARQKLSEIELQSSQLAPGDQQGDFGQDDPGFRWQEHVEATAYQHLYQVTLVVQWGPEANPNQRAFTTFLTDGQLYTTPSAASSTQGTGSGG